MTSTSIAGGNAISPARREAATRRAFRRFLVVGSASVLIDLAFYQGLTAVGWSPHGSKGVSYIAGMVFGFVANKAWAFGSKRKSLAEPATYLALYAITLGVNVGLNAAVLALFGGRFTLPAFLVATGTTTVLNFAGLRWVTFRKGMATT